MRRRGGLFLFVVVVVFSFSQRLCFGFPWGTYSLVIPRFLAPPPFILPPESVFLVVTFSPLKLYLPSFFRSLFLFLAPFPPFYLPPSWGWQNMPAASACSCQGRVAASHDCITLQHPDLDLTRLPPPFLSFFTCSREGTAGDTSLDCRRLSKQTVRDHGWKTGLSFSREAKGGGGAGGENVFFFFSSVFLFGPFFLFILCFQKGGGGGEKLI
eukprot:Hpha_TRINITY_DN15309_c4_g2::TRINITY_DN15309_c4_g2_i1::g.88963::m.88963